MTINELIEELKKHPSSTEVKMSVGIHVKNTSDNNDK